MEGIDSAARTGPADRHTGPADRAARNLLVEAKACRMLGVVACHNHFLLVRHIALVRAVAAGRSPGFDLAGSLMAVLSQCTVDCCVPGSCTRSFDSVGRGHSRVILL